MPTRVTRDFSCGCCMWDILGMIHILVGIPQVLQIMSFFSTPSHHPKKKNLILLMAEILHQFIGSLSHYLQGFIHPRWCRIPSINSMRFFFLGWWEGVEKKLPTYQLVQDFSHQQYVIFCPCLFLFPHQATHNCRWVLGVKHLTIHLGIIDDHRMQGARQNEDNKDAHGSWIFSDAAMRTCQLHNTPNGSGSSGQTGYKWPIMVL